MLFSLSEYLQMRRNEKAYQHLCINFLPCVIGRKVWDKQCYAKPVYKLATPTDEAWCLLLLENNWDVWSKQARCIMSKIDYSTYDQKGKAKWTSSSMGSGRFGGWDQDGLTRFNELTHLVRIDRKENKDFDERLTAHLQMEQNINEMSTKKNEDANENIPTIVNDLDYDSNCEDEESRNGDDVNQQAEV